MTTFGSATGKRCSFEGAQALWSAFELVQIPGGRQISTYTRIVSLLGDGGWHPESDLRGITSYPREWITELRKEGQLVAESEAGLEVRLTNWDVLRKPRGLRRPS